MLSWLKRTFTSSVGRKVIMGLTGLALIGFLIVHLAGNLTLYADDTGEAFDAYEHTLTSNPLLPIAEIGLLALFAVHIGLALKLQMENRLARNSRYVSRGDHGKKTPASSSMALTGLLTLVFIIIHLLDFRFAKEEGASMAALVKETLSDPLHGGAYFAFVCVLTMHVAHGFKSACQSLGLGHPRYSEAFERISVGLAVILGLGFASFPLVMIFTGGGSAS